MRQAEIFLEGEGEAWLERNRPQLPVEDDPVLAALDGTAITPGDVLEIGCADGWRLMELKKRYHCRVTGIDPGINPATIKHPSLFVGTADDLPFAQSFDLVIYGFCLYLCDREDLFRIVAEGDRVLKDGGHLVVFDFRPPSPRSRAYHHRDGVISYKMDHSKLWLANPAYASVYEHSSNGLGVSILKKDLAGAWPNDPCG